MSMYIRNMMIESGDGKLPHRTLRSWESERHETYVEGDSRTVQSHKDQTDINNIVARYDRTGTLPEGRMQPQYGDVSELNKPLDQAIQESRDNLDSAGQALEKVQAQAKKEKQIQAEKDAEELAAYRAAAEQIKKQNQGTQET